MNVYRGAWEDQYGTLWYSENEAGQFHHGVILRAHRLDLREEGLADVAPQVHPFPLRPEHKGIHVTIHDRQERAELGDICREMEEAGVSLVLGQFRLAAT